MIMIKKQQESSYFHIYITAPEVEKKSDIPQNFQEDFKSKLTASLLKTIWLGLREGGCYKHPHSIPPRHHRHQHHHDYYYYHHYYHAGSSPHIIVSPGHDLNQPRGIPDLRAMGGWM